MLKLWFQLEYLQQGPRQSSERQQLRSDILQKEVLAKCDVLKTAGFWPSEPTLRPRAWLENFDQSDQGTAAFLLDKFTYYNAEMTDALLKASYQSLGDGLVQSANASASDILSELPNSVFTPVTGETPNPTDSGNLMCRRARQILNIPEDLIVDVESAVNHAISGGAVIFLDDFIGSGDQFLETWGRNYNPSNPISFHGIMQAQPFCACYLSLVSTDYGLSKINSHAPAVAVSVTHTVTSKSTVQGLDISANQMHEIDQFLDKYAPRLQPRETYIQGNQEFLKYGYKNRGLMFGFEHSIPDATLPIFWSPGDHTWEPLIERT